MFLVRSEGETQTQIRTDIRANIKAPQQFASRGFIWSRDETQKRRETHMLANMRNPPQLASQIFETRQSMRYVEEVLWSGFMEYK